MVRPSAFAVRRLMVRKYRPGRSTGKGARGGALEDAIHVARGPPIVVVLVRAIGHQPAVLDEQAELVHGGDPVREREVD